MAIHLTFLRDRCKGCELCIAACPKNILALDNTTNLKGIRRKPVYWLCQLCKDVSGFDYNNRKRLRRS